MTQPKAARPDGLARRFRRATALLLLPLLGVSIVAGASLIGSNSVDDSLRDADDQATAINNVQSDVSDMGLHATVFLINGNSEEKAAVIASIRSLTDELPALSPASESGTPIGVAVATFTSAWAHGVNRPVVNAVAGAASATPGPPGLVEGALDSEMDRLNANVDAIDTLNANVVEKLQGQEDVAARAAAMAVVVALIVGVASALFVSRRLARSVLTPLGQLRRAVEGLAAGTTDQRLRIDGADEFANVGAGFNTMADQLALRAETIAQRERRTVALVEHASDGILVIDRDAQLVFATPKFISEFGTASGDLATLAEIVHVDDLARTQRAWTRLLADKLGATVEIEARLRRRNNEWRHVWARLTNLMDDAAVGGVVMNVTDVTERHDYEQRLSYQAFHDPLTGMANRALLRSRLDHVAADGPNGDEWVALLYLDLDDFKQVNDTMGHFAGDQVLQHVASTLVSVVRPQDVVARIGGDEFAILLEKASSKDAETAALRVVAALAVPFVVDGQELTVGASVGIARGRGQQVADSLFGNADLAMYFAKRDGKGTHKTYVPSMRAEVIDRLQLGADLRTALVTGHITNHYQPVVEVGTGRVVGAEALARWEHPERGNVGPNIFIPLAEEIGLVYDIDKQVLRNACVQGRKWRDAGMPDFTMAVNLSSIDLDQDDIVETVARALADSGFPAANLELEVTESVAITEFDRTEKTLGELKALGVSLAIDDFGTGYSALALLRRMPFDRLKIDKSFIDEVGGEAHGPTLVEAILDMSRALGMKVVAEGVETAGQARFLETQRCDFAQGFLFSRPLAAPAFAELVAARHALGPVLV